MGYGYIPENRRAKDVRIDNYDKKFPEGVTNVECALDHLNKELNNIANKSLTVEQKKALNNMFKVCAYISDDIS